MYGHLPMSLIGHDLHKAVCEILRVLPTRVAHKIMYDWLTAVLWRYVLAGKTSSPF